MRQSIQHAETVETTHGSPQGTVLLRVLREVVQRQLRSTTALGIPREGADGTSGLRVWKMRHPAINSTGLQQALQNLSSLQSTGVFGFRLWQRFVELVVTAATLAGPAPHCAKGRKEVQAPDKTL